MDRFIQCVVFDRNDDIRVLQRRIFWYLHLTDLWFIVSERPIEKMVPPPNYEHRFVFSNDINALSSHVHSTDVVLYSKTGEIPEPITILAIWSQVENEPIHIFHTLYHKTFQRPLKVLPGAVIFRGKLLNSKTVDQLLNWQDTGTIISGWYLYQMEFNDLPEHDSVLSELLKRFSSSV